MRSLRHILNQLFRGPPGPPGQRGPPGSVDPDMMPIRLPVSIIVLAPVPTSTAFDQVQATVAESVKFWEGIGIRLQPHIRGYRSELDPSKDYELNYLNRWDIGEHLPVIFVFPWATFLSGNNAGHAWREDGVAAVAGGHNVATGHLDEVINHELGHLLSLDHEDKTFMRAVLETESRTVTPAQRGTIRRVARQYGGL